MDVFCSIPAPKYQEDNHYWTCSMCTYYSIFFKNCIVIPLCCMCCSRNTLF